MLAALKALRRCPHHRTRMPTVAVSELFTRAPPRGAPACWGGDRDTAITAPYVASRAATVFRITEERDAELGPMGDARTQHGGTA